MPESPVVTRVVYASQSRVQGPMYAQMERIRACAVRHNEPMGVCTALAHQSGWFLQWKEGPEEAVRHIMERVLADPRHHGARVLHRSQGPRLLAGVWTMSIVQCQDSAAEFQARVEQVGAVRMQGLQYAPATVWRMLSTPLRHACARRQDEPSVFRRVLVCSAGMAESFALVQHLAQDRQQPIVRRRFAGPQALDVGSDYTDLPAAHGAVRVVAMARNGLHLGLTRALLADYSLLVLWGCGVDARDQELMDRMVAACSALPSPPAVLGVGVSAQAHRAMFLAAHRAGMIYLDGPAAVSPDGVWSAVREQLSVLRPAANGLWRQSDHALLA